MGGEITLDSKLGSGSTFSLSLPLTLADPDSLKIIYAKTGNRSTSIELASLKILLVEDNDINLQVAQAILQKSGHRVEVAKNGLSALGKLDSMDFDVVLMDRHMPIMDGLEATRRIRALGGLKSSVPVIGVTAAVNQHEIQDCIDAGMNDVVTKPIDPAALMGALAQLKIGRLNASPPGDDDGASPSPAAPETVILDSSKIDDLRKNIGEESANKLLNKFKSVSRQLMERLNSAAEKGVLEELHRGSHDLKSSAATVGLMKLSDYCRTIEALCLDGDFTKAKSMVEPLPDMLDEGIKALNF